MKNFKLVMKSLPVSLSLMFTAFAVNAADGTIQFTGNITNDSCTVDTTSAGTQTASLGTIAATSFGSSGEAAGSAPFQIVLTACPATVTSVAVRFDGNADATDARLLALDSGSSASAVGVGIYDDAGTIIPMHADSKTYAVTTTGATMNFEGKYVSTGTTVGEGSANATTEFTIQYQ